MCAFWIVRVACVAVILDRAIRTSWAVKSRSGVFPMQASTGRSESRLVSIVFWLRPDIPSASQSATAFSTV